MLTKETLKNLNKNIPTVDIKGKNYVMVNDRIKRLREYMPNSRIETEIVSLVDGIVTMKATLYDDEGNLVSTGHAQEKESNGFINKTSFVENCETSCIGRCLAIAGIGIDDSLGSADEVANAMMNQGDKKTKKEEPVRTYRDQVILFCKDHDVSMAEIKEIYGLTKESSDEEFKSVLGSLQLKYA